MGSSLVEMYTKFISHFEARLNQVRLVMLVSVIGHSFRGEPEKSLELFDSVLKSRTRLGVEASLCVDMDITLINVQMGNLDVAKIALEDAKDKVSAFSSSETMPFSKYYKACAAYRKVSLALILARTIFSPLAITKFLILSFRTFSLTFSSYSFCLFQNAQPITIVGCRSCWGILQGRSDVSLLHTYGHHLR